jgi:hypothetical protein
MLQAAIEGVCELLHIGAAVVERQLPVHVLATMTSEIAAGKSGASRGCKEKAPPVGGAEVIEKRRNAHNEHRGDDAMIAMSCGCATATGSREQRWLHRAVVRAKLSIARAELPRPTNPRHNSVAAQPCVALCAERRQVFCLDEAGGAAVRSFAGALADYIRSAGRGDRQHNSERKQGRQNAASSPSHVNPLDF